MNLKDFSNNLRNEKNVAIFCHYRPDGDTIGSAIGLSLGLSKIGVKSQVFCADYIPNKFNFLPRCAEIKKQFSGEFSAYLAIDNADVSRLGDNEYYFSNFKNTYQLDHHVSNNNFAKYNYVFDSASNCENVLDLLNQLQIPLDKEIAEYLLLGIVTDTGNFKHKNVTSKTLENASILVLHGADINKIVYNMFTLQTKERAKLFAIVMSKIRYFFNNKIAVASILSSDLTISGAKNDETEGFIDFVLGIEGVEVAVSILETGKNKFKISLRSHTVNVNEIASVYGGGGHVLASGCQIFGEYEEVIDKLTYTISQHIPE